MTAHSGISGPAAGLTGRLSERRVLDQFVAGVRAGEGRALVVRGEPGVGKTVLLDYLAGRASGCLVFAARVPGQDVAGLPALVVEGLAEDDARELLESVLTGPLDARVRDRIIAETRGNPLALRELPRGLTPAQLTGGFGVSGAVPLDGRIEESFGRQLEEIGRAHV